MDQHRIKCTYISGAAANRLLDAARAAQVLRDMDVGTNHLEVGDICRDRVLARDCK